MVLTERQKKDLQRAILEYLISDGGETVFPRTIEAFKAEAQISDLNDVDKGILEKKWTSVVRLQKRVMELETQLNDLQKQLKSGVATNGIDNDTLKTNTTIGENNRLIPKGPAKTSLAGHRGPITCVATHPIYSLVASGSEDSTIKLWDYETNQYDRTFKGHTGTITGLSFSTGSSILLASCSSDMSAKLWDMSTFNCIKTLRGHDHTLSAIKFLPSNDHIITCSRDKTIKCWEVSSGFCIRTFNGHSDWVRCIAISLDGDHIASAGTDQTIIIWKFSNGQNIQTLRGHEHVIECINFGKKPITADLSSPVKANREENNSDSNNSIDLGYLVSGSRDKTVKLWDALRGVCLMTFSAHENWVRGVVVNPTGKYIVSCSDDKSIRVFDIKESRCLRTIADAHGHFVTSIAFSQIHPIIVTGSVDKTINIWTCS
eukprot:gene17105-22619_t